MNNGYWDTSVSFIHQLIHEPTEYEFSLIQSKPHPLPSSSDTIDAILNEPIVIDLTRRKLKKKQHSSWSSSSFKQVSNEESYQDLSEYIQDGLESGETTDPSSSASLDAQRLLESIELPKADTLYTQRINDLY